MIFIASPCETNVALDLDCTLTLNKRKRVQAISCETQVQTLATKTNQKNIIVLPHWHLTMLISMYESRFVKSLCYVIYTLFDKYLLIRNCITKQYVVYRKIPVVSPPPPPAPLISPPGYRPINLETRKYIRL